MAARSVDKRREISGIIYLATAIILAVAFFMPEERSGFLGRILSHTGQWLLGVAAFSLPFLLAYMAIDHFFEKNKQVTRRRLTYVVLLLIGVATLLHLLTTDLEAVRAFSLGDDGEHHALKALQHLWQSGIDPELIATEKASLSGGVLGGGMALALHAVAGPIGSVVLVGALVLSLVVLLFNVSLTGMVGKTARAVNTTRKKVDRAVRDRADQVAAQQEEEPKTADPKSYDLLLNQNHTENDKNAAPGSNDLSGGQKNPSVHVDMDARHPSLLDRLKSFFQADEEEDGVRPLPENELSVPAFLKTESESKDKDGGGKQPASSGIDQKSAYDLSFDAPGTPDHSSELPAGIHRVGSSGPPADRAKDVTRAESTPDSFAGSREHWIDRRDPENPKQKTPGSGTQISMDFPYQAPPLKLLRDESDDMEHVVGQAVKALGRKLEKTLDSFGIEAHVVHVTTGPTLTRFELSPGPGVKVSRIVNLADDIALNLAALGVRIEAPIPGKSAIGIEIPNKETQPVLLRGLLESEEFRTMDAPLTAALGRDIQGKPILCDLARMPHLLIAGATGSGKSVCINAILMSILFHCSPEQVRMIMIDPKVVELSVYNGIPHLLAPVVTDPKKAANALGWAVNEMVRRYGLFAKKSVRDFNAYRVASEGYEAVRNKDDEIPEDDENAFEHLPFILVVIDELSDLMATSPTEVEDAIARLTAMARAAGIHLIIATQRPSVDVITGVIKANIPSRIAFAVASQVDSRTILDQAGAEKLLGKGDLLYYPQMATKPIRGQGAFITDSEVEQVLQFLKGQYTEDYDDNVSDAIMTAQASGKKNNKQENQDELFPQALDIVVETGYASVSLLQRRMNVGYPRAARLIDALHDKGYIGPFEGSKPRKLLITQAQYEELKAREDM
jgi:DNA segregation ATPase FtsK/SpoIIIE, S-DNA-T family